MSRAGKFGKLISWGLPLLAACASGQVPAHRPGMPIMRPTRGVAGPAVVTPLLTSAPPPATPMELPSVPPQVSYRDGMLTIVAQNSSLGDILREVHRSTGATIEIPSNATERVVTRIGPGPARDVLASLLNGSAFNYVMLGSMTDPTSLASVVLTMKPAGGAPGRSGENAANAYQPVPQPYPGQQAMMAPGMGPGGPVVQPAQPEDEEADAEEEKDEEDPAEEEQAQDQAQNGVAGAPDASQPNGGPKTPEQILEMLRQRPPGQVAPGQIPGQVIQPHQPPQSDDNEN